MTKFVRFDTVSYGDTLAFGRNQYNRAYNHAHLEKMKKAMKESLDVMPPITINAITNHIIDGQHRLKAYQSLINSNEIASDVEMKVMYVEIPESEEKKAIVDANTNSKTWSLDDYIASYAKAELLPYVKLDEWCKMHTLASDKGRSKFRYGASIITGKRCADILKNGQFTFTDDDLKKADEIHAEMLEIVQLFNLRGKGSWIEALATSWSEARGQHSFKTWMRELKAKKNRFMKLPKNNSKDWDNIFAQAHYAIDKKAGL